MKSYDSCMEKLGREIYGCKNKEMREGMDASKYGLNVISGRFPCTKIKSRT